ncbi:MAG TPA: hypothetical protein VN613_08505 [Gemmatimonadaceae bacterium]|nr:hypothetical protein [Gemmatimonadaceae bacterium]
MMPGAWQVSFFFSDDNLVAQRELEDVRERVLEELRPGVVAQWTDPLERLRAPPPSRTQAGRVEARSIR